MLYLYYCYSQIKNPIPLFTFFSSAPEPTTDTYSLTSELPTYAQDPLYTTTFTIIINNSTMLRISTMLTICTFRDQEYPLFYYRIELYTLELCRQPSISNFPNTLL